MKVLLDENIPHDLRHELPGHQVFTVAYMGWSAQKNGKLLQLAAQSGFDALLTTDAGMQFQQHTEKLPISIVILRSKTRRLDRLTAMVPELLLVLTKLQPKSLVVIG